MRPLSIVLSRVTSNARTYRAGAGAGGWVAGAVPRAVAQTAAGGGHQQGVAECQGLARAARVAAERVPQRQVQRAVVSQLAGPESAQLVEPAGGAEGGWFIQVEFW